MIMTPFFFMGVPFWLTGLTSMASEGGRVLVPGSLMIETPSKEVFFLSQSSPVSRNARRTSFSSMVYLRAGGYKKTLWCAVRKCTVFPPCPLRHADIGSPQMDPGEGP